VINNDSIIKLEMGTLAPTVGWGLMFLSRLIVSHCLEVEV